VSQKTYQDLESQHIFLSGHAACPGCGEAVAIRYTLNTLGPRTVAVLPPSCVCVLSGAQPYSSMRIPVYQTTLESSAASASGIARALRSQGKDDVNVLAMAGDGGTYDIGIQALSGAAERNEDIIYVCLDNEAYMNTGAQKSGATPTYARTSSTPGGKQTSKKNLVEIMAAHEIPYVATATIGHPDDLVRKVAKARDMKGTRFLLILTPCSQWGIADDSAVRISRLAVETGVFPLYEVEPRGRYTVNHGPTGAPVEAYLRLQKRYSRLTPEQVRDIQTEVDHNWAALQARAQWANDVDRQAS
jgi:pyruvate/2-oxoacid:ferredoxin oxidoreductase beta subunit